MAAPGRRGLRTSQPTGAPSGLAVGTPLADGLLWASDGRYIYTTSGIITPLVGVFPTSSGMGGYGATPVIATGAVFPRSATNFTCFVRGVNIGGSGDNFPNLIGHATYASESSNAGFNITLRSSVSEGRRFGFSVLNNNAQATYQLDSTSNGSVAGAIFSAAGVSRPSQREIYINGVLENTKAAASGMAVPTDNRSLGDNTGGTQIIRTMAAAVWDRALSAFEIAEIHRNPWQIFAPTERRIWIPQAAAADYIPPRFEQTRQAVTRGSRW